MDAFQSSQRFQPYLFAAERILWTGQPKQGISFNQNDVLAIPFSFLWGGFAIYWNYGVWTSFPSTGTPDDWLFKLWGLPFLAVGLYLIAGRFFYEAWIRSRTYYAVTSARVLILRGRPNTKFISRDIRSLPMLELAEHRGDTGTIAFDSDDAGYSIFGRKRAFGIWPVAASANAQFYRIEDARRVYNLIRDQSHR